MKTLKDLKEFLNQLNETQLAGEIIVAGDEDEGLFSTTVTSFSELEEDYFVSDEGMCPVSTHDEDCNEPLSECEIIPKGTVYLYQI